MTRTRAIPIIILVALVAGITVAFLAVPPPQEGGLEEKGPLAALSPVTVKKVRVLHVLAGHDKRKVAPDYVW